MKKNTSTSEPRSYPLPWLGDRPTCPTTVHVQPQHDTPTLATGGRIRGWRLRDEHTIESSWRDQVLCVTDRLGPLRLQAQRPQSAFGGVAPHQPALWPWPLAPILVVGTAPGPVAVLGTELRSRQLDWREHLHRFFVKARQAFLVDRGHRWVEPAVVAVGPRKKIRDWEERIFERCRELMITRAVRIVDGRWEVLDVSGVSGMEDVVLSSDPCTLTLDRPRRCTLAQAPESDFRCTMVGGPYGSRAIDAAAAWRQSWASLNEAVGCDTCEGRTFQFQGRTVTGNPIISLTPVPVPTRWLDPYGYPPGVVRFPAAE